MTGTVFHYAIEAVRDTATPMPALRRYEGKIYCSSPLFIAHTNKMLSQGYYLAASLHSVMVALLPAIASSL